MVTGAGGFIGRRLVSRLQPLCGEIIGLQRSPPKELCEARVSDQQEPLAKLTWISGDIAQAECLREALRHEPQVVFHLAGATLVKTLAEYLAINQGGAENLVTACREYPSVERVVFVSSLAAAGPNQGIPLEEADVPRPVSYYGRSKLAAEQAFQAAAGDLPCTIVRPPSVFGPGDPFFLKLFRAVKSGWNPLAGRADWKYSVIHVDDLVDCLIQAAQRGTTLDPRLGPKDFGQSGVYFAADPMPLTFVEIGELIAEALDCPPARVIQVPRPLTRLVAHLNWLFWAVTGRSNLVNPDKMREAYAGNWSCSPARAERELGWRVARDVPTRLAETTVAYRQAGLLPPA